MWGIYYFYGLKQAVKKMDVFTGTINAKMDAKGRVFVPASFRKILQSSGEVRFMLRKDVYKDCLILCLVSTWKEKLADLRKRLDEWDEEEQALFRTISASVEPVELDSTGRLLIPRKYMLKLNISNSVCFVGMDNMIEIWSSDKLNEILMNSDDLKSHVRKFLSSSRRISEKADQ